MQRHKILITISRFDPMTTIDLTDAEKNVLVHTLTGSKPSRKVYRNFFAADQGHNDMEHIARLVEMGLMIKGKMFNSDGNYFHCTNSGAAIVGLQLMENG